MNSSIKCYRQFFYPLKNSMGKSFIINTFATFHLRYPINFYQYFTGKMNIHIVLYNQSVLFEYSSDPKLTLQQIKSKTTQFYKNISTSVQQYTLYLHFTACFNFHNSIFQLFNLSFLIFFYSFYVFYIILNLKWTTFACINIASALILSRILTVAYLLGLNLVTSR